MTSRPSRSAGRSLVRLAVAGAVVVGLPMGLAGTANAAPDSAWDKLAQCESGGRWDINTGNGYAGGLQFSPSTWRAFGGAGSASQASRTEQIAVAERVLAAQGWNAWPSCSQKTGVRGNAASVRASAPLKEATPEVAPKAAPKAAPKVAPKAAPLELPAAPRIKNGADYTVVAGDTLSKIAGQQNVAGGWQALFERNTDVVSNADVIFIGQQLDLR